MIGVGESRHTIPVRRLVPSLLTTISLASGLASLHFALAADWDRALAAIAVAAVFDVLDGAAARVLKAASRFGAVLDSLSDFLSFGVAPAVMLHQWMLREAGAVGLAATMTFVICSAMRLARFTSQRKRSSPPAMMMFFMGLPTPAAAGAVLIPVMMFATHSLQLRLPEWLVIAHTLVIAWLMISRIPTFSIKKIRINRRLAPLLMVAVGLLVVGASKEPWLTAAGITAAYLLTIPLSIVTAGRLKRKMAAAQQSRSGAPGLGAPVEPQRSFVEQSAPHQ